ncbi:LysR substrate-binding domain-containing protein [Chelatococcus sp. SYSU_G07232]|uniref:LysR substrate-binding domain-containing protein n=1 Tax=Chelatococcus albus TaxID=3047466 RepID=A0ABT7AL07_9HYPH|nr:LysR substrate-binding domain-containing protein [Chelatococcus sp. SYSU_G07232]MDJ1160063.1 LysR substrate-binding domain-containing protein [Chelatococcus sp. SYSU_G07232]
MNIVHLRAFHLVAQAGSFTHAARAGGVSQPTLSAQVRALEQMHGVNLFNRRGRGVTLTPLGQNLFTITTRLFAAEDEARALIAGSRTLARGHLRVAADSPTHVMPLLAALKRRHAGLTFSLRVGNSSDVLKQILDYDADVAVMAKRTSDPRIHSLRLRADRLVLFVPQAHPWVHRQAVALQELTGRDLVIRERGSITREVFEARLSEAGVRPGTLVEVQTREAVREAVVAGFGIGIVFDSELGSDADIHALDVADADLTVEEYVVCREERRRIPLLRGFLEIAHQAVAEAPQG